MNNYQTYFILNEVTGLVKIGKAVSPKRRLAELGRMNGRKLKLLAVFSCSGVTDESRLHKQFRDLRKHGEWFRYEEPIRVFLASTGKAEITTYADKTPWTTICLDCLRPIHSGSKRCIPCAATINCTGRRRVYRGKFCTRCGDYPVIHRNAVYEGLCFACALRKFEGNLFANLAIEGPDEEGYLHGFFGHQLRIRE